MNIELNILNIKKALPKEVKLIAVSKTKPDEMIKEAYAAGQRDFGENYIQELCTKQLSLPSDIRWHAIGHLQSNKVKYIAPFVHLIHGVDSFKLLQEINKQAQKNDRAINCLLQIHIAAEETKFGFSYEECEALFYSSDYKALEHVRIKGLMGMASNTEDAARIRKEFAVLKAFFDKVKEKYQLKDFDTLSMGMSGDYKIAIEEGSTMIRLGSSIFGARDYPV